MIKYSHKKFTFKLLFFQSLCAGLGLCLGMAWGITNQFSQYKDRIYKQTKIAGIDVSGKTQSEALQSVEDYYLHNILEEEIAFTLEEKNFKLPFKQVIKGTNLEAVIVRALGYTKHLDIIEKGLLLISKYQIGFDISIDFDEKAINTFVEDVIKQIEQEPKDANIKISHNGNIDIIPDVKGYIINKDEFIKAVTLALNNLSGSTINLMDFTTKQSPNITTEYLYAIDTLIASDATTFTPNTGKATNIELSAATVDNILLMPGEVFSFNTIVGDTTAEKGYKDGPIIMGSKIAQGLGGGVCQVSSTLYNAVLKTGLYSVSRRPHSMPSTYVPLGLDATVSWGSIDYQFKNTLEYPIYLQAYVKEDQLYVNIYSNHALKDKEYKLKSEVYEVLKPTTKYISNHTLSKGNKSLVQRGREGYKVKVTREVYEKDVLKQTEVISMDTYKPIEAIYHVGA